jgi:hypothetical protein
LLPEHPASTARTAAVKRRLIMIPPLV